jgi:uncharacterized protein (TIGR03083 family)
VTTPPSGDQIATAYARSADRICEIAPTLDAAQLATNVPGTPKWSARDLLAHLVGVPCDLIAGHTAGAPGDAWTDAQVQSRRDRQVGDLIDEWSQLRPRIDEVCRSGNMALLAYDVATHEQDLRGALGLEAIPDPETLDLLVTGMAGRAVKAVADAGLPPLLLTDGDGWSVGDAGGVTVSASRLELSRLLTGRRSVGQATALEWTGNPAPYLGLLSPFGPLRDSDVVEA